MSSPFSVGDVVNVSHLPDYMSHFRSGVAIISKVIHTKCQEGTDFEYSYSLVFFNDKGVLLERNNHSWYHPSNLTFIGKEGKTALRFLSEGFAVNKKYKN